MARLTGRVLKACAAFATLFAALASQAAPRADVMAILADHCTLCHDAEDPPGGLRLDRWEDAQAAIAHGVVVAGSPGASPLFTRLLLPRDDEHAMPPADAPTRPSDTEIAVLREWIAGMPPTTPWAVPYTAAPTEAAPDIVAPSGAAPEEPISRLQAAGAFVGRTDLRSTWLRVDLGPVGFPLRHEALEDLRAIGPWVRDLVVAWAPGPVPLAELAALAPNLRRLDAAHASPATLAGLEEAAHLVWLNLTASEVTDEMVAEFRPGPRLTKIVLAHTAVTDAALAAFAAAHPDVVLSAPPPGGPGEPIAWSEDQRAVWTVSNALWSAVASSAWDTVADSAHEAWIGTLPGGLAVSSVEAWREVADDPERPPSAVVRHTPVRLRVVGDVASVQSRLTRVPPISSSTATRTTVFLTETYARTETGWKCLTATIANTVE